jgi:hypothetical protein
VALEDIWLNPILLHWPFPTWKRSFFCRRLEAGIPYFCRHELGGAQFALDDRREESAEIKGIETKNYFAEQFFVEIQIKQAFCDIDKEYLGDQGDDRR